MLPELAAANEGRALADQGLQPGDHIGPYELDRRLGAGGMAEVWLAQRADGAFKREVALKLPTLTRLRADLEQRFARERDILASLEHPHIARLYDAGVDPKGLPYCHARENSSGVRGWPPGAILATSVCVSVSSSFYRCWAPCTMHTRTT